MPRYLAYILHRSAEHLNIHIPRLQATVEELQRLIHRVYPAATFQVVLGDDPARTYVVATVDVDDTETVIDVYIDRLLEFQIDESLPVYVIPVRPLARVPAP